MSYTPKAVQDVIDAITRWEGPSGDQTAVPVVEAARRLRDAYRPPCPITKKVALTEMKRGAVHDWEEISGHEQTGMKLVLHPAAPGEVEGRYTWERD